MNEARFDNGAQRIAVAPLPDVALLLKPGVKLGAVGEREAVEEDATVERHGLLQGLRPALRGRPGHGGRVRPTTPGCGRGPCRLIAGRCR